MKALLSKLESEFRQTQLAQGKSEQAIANEISRRRVRSPKAREVA